MLAGKYIFTFPSGKLPPAPAGWYKPIQRLHSRLWKCLIPHYFSQTHISLLSQQEKNVQRDRKCLSSAQEEKRSRAQLVHADLAPPIVLGTPSEIFLRVTAVTKVDDRESIIPWWTDVQRHLELLVWAGTLQVFIPLSGHKQLHTACCSTSISIPALLTFRRPKLLASVSPLEAVSFKAKIQRFF